MSKELVISANRHETKVAILEDDLLVEVFFQRANEYSLAGSIHKGRVTRVLPGMQSAFVDLGLDRDTFLYVSDFFEEENEDFDRVTPRDEPRRQRENRLAVEAARPVETARPVEAAVPPAEVQAAPAEGNADASAAPASAPTPSTAPPPRPSGRPEDGDRDRHGRRGRRRRNRGHGFPDSKYASPESRYQPRAAEPSPATVRPPAAEAPPSEPAAEDFSLLPGESLAKYSRANIQPLDEGEREEIESLHEPEPEAVLAPPPEETPVAHIEAPEVLEAPFEDPVVTESVASELAVPVADVPEPDVPGRVVASPDEPEVPSQEMEAAGVPGGSVEETKKI